MTGVVTVLVGVDCDRPRLQYRDAPGFDKELREVCGYLETLLERWSSSGMGWTLFLCGAFVEIASESRTSADLHAMLGVAYDAGEIACHSFRHNAVATVPGRSDIRVVTLSELKEELDANTALLSSLKLIGEDPIGFRAPYGFAAGGISAARMQVISTRRSYSSSLLRSKVAGICPPLVEDGMIRQPVMRRCGIWELPSHGWHDTVFAGLSKSSNGPGPDRPPWEHYADLVREAAAISDQLEREIFVGLTLHPVAMKEYDRDQCLLERIADASVVGGHEISFTSFDKAVAALESRPVPELAFDASVGSSKVLGVAPVD